MMEVVGYILVQGTFFNVRHVSFRVRCATVKGISVQWGCSGFTQGNGPISIEVGPSYV